MVSNALIITSEVTGFISFFLTILTWLGVYISLFTTSISAPHTIPLILGNLRQELLSERSLMKYRMREGDQYHVWPGRQFRKVGNQQSHAKLAHDTLKLMWREFRDVEKVFTIGDVGDAEDGRISGSSDEDNTNEEKRNGVTSQRRIARRNSVIKNSMGVCEAGLSVDRRTYYNCDLWHRFLWWYNTSNVQSLTDRLQKLQIRRMERDLFETDELVKRGLQVLGNMSGEDIWYPGAKGRGPSGGKYSESDDDGSTRQRRSRKKNSRHTATGSTAGSRVGSRSARMKKRRSGNQDRDSNVREVYEREIIRTRNQRSSGEDEDGSDDEPSPRSRSGNRRRRSGNNTDTAPATTVTANTAAQRRRSRAGEPSQTTYPTEYEIISPGRIYVETEYDGDDRRSVRGGGRRSVYDDGNDDRNRSRRQSQQQPGHRPRSYSRDRDQR